MVTPELAAAAAAAQHRTLMTEAARRRLRREALAAVAPDESVDRGSAIARYLRSVEERLDRPGQRPGPARTLAT